MTVKVKKNVNFGKGRGNRQMKRQRENTNTRGYLLQTVERIVERERCGVRDREM